MLKSPISDSKVLLC